MKLKTKELLLKIAISFSIIIGTDLLLTISVAENLSQVLWLAIAGCFGFIVAVFLFDFFELKKNRLK